MKVQLQGCGRLYPQGLTDGNLGKLLGELSLNPKPQALDPGPYTLDPKP